MPSEYRMLFGRKALAAGSVVALASVAALLGQALRQGEAEEYTRYQLLAPETAQFRIVYEVTATTPGAKFYFNPIRKGSVATDEAVYDQMTGQPLKFEVVSGAEARTSGMANADPDTSYIRVHLPRMVPERGEVRLRIDKTYKDPKSYYREGDLIVFARSLGIKKNAVVLPPGYELVSCNVPSQVLSEPDGRIKISFINTAPDAAPLVVKARATEKGIGRDSRGTETQRRADTPADAVMAPAAAQDEGSRLSERAHQNRDIVYFLQAPETHAFSLYHDYTERGEGTDKYLNVVRQGSTVSNPSALLLDTGEPLKTETLKGEQITRAGLDIGEKVRPDSEVVVVWFPPVKKGQSIRLRIEETYTDPGRYRLEGEELVFDRAFGRPFDAVVLPAGWLLTASSIPGVVSQMPDGRIRLDFVNPRPDDIAVLIKAKRGPRQ